MLNRFVRLFGGDPNKREIERYTQIVEQVNGLEAQYEQISMG
jgi:preprotein translocase subunit SecA